MRKRCSCCWNFSEAGVSTSDFLPIPDFPFLRECFARRPSVSTFLTVSIIVKRMVELWRFHQPAIVRDSTVSENICHHRETNRRSFPLFFLFLSPPSPPNPFFSPILYSLLRSSTSQAFVLLWIRFDLRTRSNWKLRWNYPGFVILDFIGDPYFSIYSPLRVACLLPCCASDDERIRFVRRI